MVMQWTVNPPSSGTTGSIPVQPTKQFRGKCYGSTADSKPAGRGSIPWPWANIGSKVFMDAHEPVTLEEGDRYPLGPPIKGESSWGRDSYNNGWNFINVYTQKFTIRRSCYG